MQGSQQGNNTDGDHSNPLENAQGAWLQMQYVLRIKGKSHCGGAADCDQKKTLSA
jgi:hypothetical protein